MSWIRKLYETYDNCQSMVGYSKDESKRPLLPICHMTAQAHIEIVIDQEGNFRRARVVTDKNDASTIIPCTEGSGSRAGKKPECHPLCDQLQYVAGDFEKYGGTVTIGFVNDPEEPYRNYIKVLTDWCESKFAHPKAQAVLKYVKKKNLIKDLIAHQILFVGEDRKLLPKSERKRQKTASDIFAVVGSQEDSFIRWEVEVSGELETKVWKDKTLWDSWIQYYFSTKKKEPICFVTGVPGSGKTLVGLHVATTHFDRLNDLYSVFLSGNGPLVAILREALTRDKVRREKEKGNKIKKHVAMSEVKMFIQNVHNFRDECLVDTTSPPVEHVALFDEAQRAWNLEQTASFMSRKKKTPNFNHSEPEFLISCLDRHPDWAVVVCLVGGGQEINTGEAGISEWIKSLERSFGDWDIYISSRLSDSEYSAEEVLKKLESRPKVEYNDMLHLAVSMRSFRAEHVSLLVKQLLDLNLDEARETLEKIKLNYSIVITRDLSKAKQWLKQKARGSERYGIVVSSQAERLKPHAIFVKSPVDPVHWFLDGKDDTRSSYYLEDVATEFDVQGLELDWVCVTWDADFRFTKIGWEHWSFVGQRWNKIRKEERKIYLKNAYRVLLTRARQGMVIVVPQGDDEDHTRPPKFYDSTFNYLKEIGFEEI